jgi:nitroimidazol reductase NimA-like FMN-containing flavoprotein (pyridoxamine 5'-phosphate oxidase superfamily)
MIAPFGRNPGEDTGSRVRIGHRKLLDDFRGFLGFAAPDAEGRADVAGLRALVAFLRQGVQPFARWEEQQLEAEREDAGDAAFEHAFLAAETEALARAVDRLAAGDDEWGEVNRRLHRIEALLELHVLRGEDEVGEPAESPSPRSRPEALSPEEAEEFLRRHEWGVLATVGAGQPYAVPVGYGFDGRYVYFASAPGRKLSNLLESPLVCLTVLDVVDGNRWCSVILSGTAEPVTDLPGRMRAVRAIQRQRGSRVTAQDVARFARATLIRITPTEITGRRRG